MARLNSDFEVAWSSLSGSAVAEGWRSISVGSAGPISLFAGRRFPGNVEALLAGFKSIVIPLAEQLPDGQGFSVERADPHGDGGTWLALSREESGSMELFAAMACDVASALDAAALETNDEARLLRIFLGRVRAWQEFMRKGARALGPEAEIGLIGELVILSSLIVGGLPAHIAVDSWLGPLDAVQDFEVGSGAIEVKCTISNVGFPARIGSLEQLDSAVRQPLYLAGVRLRQSSVGKNLPDFVDRAVSLVADDAQAFRVLSNRLVSSGYFSNHSDRYPRRFELAEIRVFEVTDEFPRMTHATVPVGVNRATYDIDLDKISVEVVDLATALKKLGAT